MRILVASNDDDYYIRMQFTLIISKSLQTLKSAIITFGSDRAEKRHEKHNTRALFLWLVST